MTGSVGRRLRRLLGIDERLLARTSDATYYTLMVGMALVIAVVAAVFMANAILYALGPGSWPAAIGGGLVWGALVLLIDLSVLLPEPYVEPDTEVGDSAHRANRHRRTKVAVRVIVAVAIGYLIAEPLMATLFRRDVNAELPTAEEAYDTELDRVADEAAELVEAEMENRQQELDAAEEAHAAQEAKVAELTPQCGEDPQFCDDLQVAREAAGQQLTQVNFLRESMRRFETQRTDAIERAQDAYRAEHPLDEQDFGPASLGAWERFAKTHELLGAWIWVVSGAIVLIDTMVVSLKLLKGVTDYERELGFDTARVQDEVRDRETQMAFENRRYRPVEVAAQAHTIHARRMRRYGVDPLPSAPPPPTPTAQAEARPATAPSEPLPTVAPAPTTTEDTEDVVDIVDVTDAATATATSPSSPGPATRATTPVTPAAPVPPRTPADREAPHLGDTVVLDLSDVGYLHGEPSDLNGSPDRDHRTEG
jgi:hypothetical protein